MSLGKTVAKPWLGRAMFGVSALAVIVGAYAVISLVTGQGGGPAPGGGSGGSATGLDTERPPRPTLSPPGAGPETLVGRIVDGGGVGLGGLSVTAEIDDAEGADSTAGPGLELASAVVGLTDGAGEFELRGLFPGRYRLRVEGEGVATSDVRFVDVPGQKLQIVVARQVAMSGTVVDGDGAPVAGVSVRAHGSTGSSREATTGQDGGFLFDRIAEDIYHVWAQRDGEAAPAIRVERFGAGPFEPISLTLGPAARVRGRVVDAETAEGVVADVTLLPDSATEPPRATRSGEDGWFVIAGVPPGRVSVQATAPGYLASESVSFSPEAPYEPTLEVSRGGVVEGRVVDGEGRAIAGAIVSARGKNGAGLLRVYPPAVALAARRRWQPGVSGVVGAQFIPRGELGVMVGPIPFPPAEGTPAARVAIPVLPADPAGSARVPLPSRIETDAQGSYRITGVEPGAYRLVAAHPGYADAVSGLVRVSLGTDNPRQSLVLRRGLFLVGEVLGEAGPIAGAEVRVSTAAGTTRSAISGGDGRYRLGPVVGAITVIARASGHGRLEVAIVVEAQPGGPTELRRDLRLVSARSRLVGRVRDSAGFPVAGAVVTLGTSGRKATADDAGRYEIDGVPPGRHDAVVSHIDYPARSVTLTTGTIGELSLAFGGGVSVSVRDAHGRFPIAGARIRGAGPASVRAEGVTDDRGRVTLRALVAGSWSLEVGGPGYVSSTRRVAVPAGRKPREITVRDLIIEIERGATVAGIIRDENGERVRGARVSVGARSGNSDESGRFRLDSVQTGDVVIEARRGRRRGQLRVGLAPGDELVTLQINLRPGQEAPTDAGATTEPPTDDDSDDPLDAEDEPDDEQ